MTECIANAVFLRSRARKEEELARRLEELVLASRSDSGVMIYDLHRSAADPVSWFIYERYESQEHFNRHREELTRFGRIPSHKATLIWLAARYAFVEKSILVVTEGLGQQRFHGRIVLLVNEHTASAGEMVSAFAEENNLATIVGTKTPGRLLSGSAYKVGHGYILGLPVAAYLTWQGRMLENNGMIPKFSVELSREALIAGRDTQLETAVEVARRL
jgi:quinol monooxygenase YgiN